jgi:uncharacterized membrane protein HdeD (DUF308 family)
MIRKARGLSALYFFRAGFSAVWVTLVSVLASSARGGTPNDLAGALLVAYPLSDVVATVFDVFTTRPASSPLPQYANVAAGIAAACGILIAVNSNLPAAVSTFGAWAIVAGGIQLILAARRRRQLSGQWLMIISGGGSVFAGITFIGWSGSTQTGLNVLAQYSAGGAVWYVLCALWLVHSARFLATPSRRASASP